MQYDIKVTSIKDTWGIPLTKGAVALVDKSDYEMLAKHKWQLFTKGYAARTGCTGRKNGNHKHFSIRMHRAIMNAPAGVQVDHINGNKLDNRKTNLRFCTQSNQNQMNVGLRKDNKSGYKGVCWDDGMKKYKAQIQNNRVRKILGYFHNKHEAAVAYNRAAKELFGEFAWLNDIKEKV